MRRMRFVTPPLLVALAALIAASCASMVNHKDEAKTMLVPPPIFSDSSDPFMLCAAGVPNTLYGPEENPNFAKVFAELQGIGFDTFFPDFSKIEVEGKNEVFGHAAYFYNFDPESIPYAGGPQSPYRAARGKIKILFPAFMFVPSHEEWATGIDETGLRERLHHFKKNCLEGDDSLLSGLYIFDEPVSNNVCASVFQDRPPISYAALQEASDVLRSVFPTTPLVMIEGQILDIVKYYPVYGELTLARNQMREEFWRGVDETVAVCDWYGFDFYPVPKTKHLGSVGEFVRQTVAHAPGKKILCTLQGFGEEDLGREGEGRRPTPEEARFMAYDAIINGADGLVWWGQSAMDITEDDALWEAIKSVASEVRALDVIRTLVDTPVLFGNAKMEVLARRGDTGVYILAANTSAEDETFSLFIPPCENPKKTTYRLTDFFSGKVLHTGTAYTEIPTFRDSLTQPDNTWKERFKPYGVRVYLVEYA